MARYSEKFKGRAVARLLPPDSAALDVVAREVGIGAGTLERWRDDVLSMPARGRAWTAAARLEAVIVTAALDEAGKSAWCREHGVYPEELHKWRTSATTALAEPEELTGMALYLASGASSFTTGATMLIDGGQFFGSTL